MNKNKETAAITQLPQNMLMVTWFVTFVAMKLTILPDWNWVWVMMPVWILPAIFVLGLLARVVVETANKFRKN